MHKVGERSLPDSMRVLLITDDRGDALRIEETVSAALAAGVRAVQLRERSLSARALGQLCERLRPTCDDHGAILFVNDRADLVAAGLADGVHLGWRSLPPDCVRRFLPPPTLIGVSTHDAKELDRAADGGADFATLSPVFPTSTHPGTEALGVPLAVELTAHARLPVLWLGGLDPDRARAFAQGRPFGIAVSSAVCGAADPEAAARRLLEALG